MNEFINNIHSRPVLYNDIFYPQWIRSLKFRMMNEVSTYVEFNFYSQYKLILK